MHQCHGRLGPLVMIIKPTVSHMILMVWIYAYAGRARREGAWAAPGGTARPGLSRGGGPRKPRPCRREYDPFLPLISALSTRARFLPFLAHTFSVRWWTVHFTGVVSSRHIWGNVEML